MTPAEADGMDDPEALRYALETVQKWGRPFLPEDESDLECVLVHEETLLMHCLIAYPDVDPNGDAPAKLTEAGALKLELLRRKDGGT